MGSFWLVSADHRATRWAILPTLFLRPYSHEYVHASIAERSVACCGYLKDGLRSDNGLAALAHELAVAAHLWSAGFDLEFADIEDGTRFDILARKDGIDLEVDCKTASGEMALHS